MRAGFGRPRAAQVRIAADVSLSISTSKRAAACSFAARQPFPTLRMRHTSGSAGRSGRPRTSSPPSCESRHCASRAWCAPRRAMQSSGSSASLDPEWRTSGARGSRTARVEAPRYRGVVVGSTRSRRSRVRIDRFTQGVVPGALFDEETDQGGRVRLRLELREPGQENSASFCSFLKDLLTGEIAVGGTSAVGRGRSNGTATVCLEDGWSVDLDPPSSRKPLLSKRSASSGPRPSTGVPLTHIEVASLSGSIARRARLGSTRARTRGGACLNSAILPGFSVTPLTG